MWKPRLIALDLDGTVVDRDDTIPKPIVAAVQDALRAGIHVLISTGRGWRGTEYHIATLGLPPGPHVTSNGAVIVRFPPFSIQSATTFDPRTVIEAVSAEYPEAYLAVEQLGQSYLIDRPFPRDALGLRVEVAPREQLWAQPVTRVVIHDPAASDEDFIELAHRLGLDGVAYSVGYTGWLDIAPEGVNKAVGLHDVTSRLGVDRSDVLALGDGRNDTQMLAWAGRGVALGDAPEEVKDAADHVTGLFADGGTVDEIRRWL